MRLIRLIALRFLFTKSQRDFFAKGLHEFTSERLRMASMPENRDLLSELEEEASAAQRLSRAVLPGHGYR